MGEINRALGNAGAPMVVPVGEKRYRLSVLNGKRMGTLEAWVEGEVIAGLQRHKAQLDRQDYLDLLKMINESIAEKEYSYGRPACTRILQGTFPGQV
jgi:hypothetical protein